MGRYYEKAFTILEQNKLLEHPPIDYVGVNNLRFTKEFINKLISSCSSIPKIRKFLDNALIESFFRHMKYVLACEHFDNLQDLKAVVDESMLYYNYERPIYEKNKMTPQ